MTWCHVAFVGQFSSTATLIGCFDTFVQAHKRNKEVSTTFINAVMGGVWLEDCCRVSTTGAIYCSVYTVLTFYCAK